jgi:hypothetical protein
LNSPSEKNTASVFLFRRVHRDSQKANRGQRKARSVTAGLFRDRPVPVAYLCLPVIGSFGVVAPGIELSDAPRVPAPPVLPASVVPAEPVVRGAGGVPPGTADGPLLRFISCC